MVSSKTPTQAPLRSLDQRMEENIVNAGAIEFNEVFDQAIAEQQGAATAAR